MKMSVTAHKVLGELTNAYIDTQLCELEEYESIHGTVTSDSLTPRPLPRVSLICLGEVSLTHRVLSCGSTTL